MDTFDKLGLRKPLKSLKKAHDGLKLTDKTLNLSSEAPPSQNAKKEQAVSGAPISLHTKNSTALVKTVDGVPFPRLFRRADRLKANPLEPYKTRTTQGQWAQGASGNPLGRPPGFEEYAYAMTGGGLEMVDHALTCLRGSVIVRWQDEDTGEEMERTMPADPKYQFEAGAYLDRKAEQHAARMATKTGTTTGNDLSALSIDEKRQLVALLAKARHGAKLLESGTTTDSIGSVSRDSVEGECVQVAAHSPTLSPGLDS